MTKQMNIRFRLIFILSFTCIACIVLCGCSSLSLYSDWRDRKIVIDGKYSDWPNAQTYYNEDKKIVVNLLNDSEYMYICLITRNREMEVNLTEKSLVAWFDRMARKNKAFGIRFPMALERIGMTLDEENKDMTSNWEDQQDKSEIIDRQKERLRDKNFLKHLEDIEELQGSLEIVTGPLKKKEGRKQRFAKKGFQEDKPNEFSLEEAAKLGIEAKLGHENDYFVYELKVPLAKSSQHTYAVEAIPGQLIGLGLEIPGSTLATRRYLQDETGLQIWAVVRLSAGQSN